MAERYKQSNPNLIPVCKKRAFNFNISISLICSKCEVFSKRNFTQCLFIVEYYLNINKKCNRVKSEIFEHCFLANNVKLFIKVSGELFPEKNCNPGQCQGFSQGQGYFQVWGATRQFPQRTLPPGQGQGLGQSQFLGFGGNFPRQQLSLNRL